MSTWSPALASRRSPPGRTLELEAWVALPEEEGGELVDGFVTEEEVSEPILELVAGRFTRSVAATAGVLREVPGCPGLEIDLDRLWAELARLDPNDAE